MNVRWDEIAESLRRRTRTIVTVRGIACLGAAIVVLLWMCGLADWLVRFDAPWQRLLLLSAFCAGVVTVAWRHLWQPLTTPLTNVDVARMIERRFPQWGDRLSSAAQFREERYADRLGSPSLQQVTTADVDSRLGEVDVDRVIDARPTQRLVWAAAAIVVLGLGSALWQRTAAATVLTRLALPFADVQWPRSTALQFLNADLEPLSERPQRTAAGEPLAFYVENSLGPLPGDATLQIRLPDGEEELRTLQTTTLRDETGKSHDVGLATLTFHTGPITFRALGGDDSGTQWHPLEVVPSPALADFTMTITPPSYVAEEPRVLEGAGAVEALVGSRVRISGTANTPLASGVLHREGQPPQRMSLDEDGLAFAVEFPVENAGPSWYWFEIADANGLSPTDPSRYELRGVADRKPTVFIDEPAGDVSVTADAELPLRIIASDDLGIRGLRLIYSRPDTPPQEMPMSLSVELPTDETVEMTWTLSSLGLSAGDRLTYHAEAVDAFDLPDVAPNESQSADPTAEPSEVDPASGSILAIGAGQIGISAFRHIEILSSEEKRRELAARQLGILDTLQDVQDRQSQALESTAGLRIQSELTDRLPGDDLDLLKQTELEQQALRERLTDVQTGAAGEVERLQQELQRNHIDDQQMAGQLGHLSENLRLLTEDLLPRVEQSLARARKLSEPEAAEEMGDETSQQLRISEQTQSSALAVLKDATAQLGGWRQQYEVTSEVDDLIASQQDVHEQTQDVGRQTLTRRPDDLSQQEQADLARLSDRQRRLATRLENLLNQDDAGAADDDLAKKADAIGEALKRLSERRALDLMHQAAESLKRNDIAGTSRAQEQVLNDLRGFSELLQAGGEEAAESLLSSIEDQVEEVETLKKRQEELADRSQQWMGPTADPDREEQLQRLTKDQQQLAEQAEDLARELRQAQRQQSAQSAERAGRRMREAQQAIAQVRPEQASGSQREALDDLTQLAGELAQQRQQIESELARQQIEQLSEDLQLLADEQESVTSSTVELEARQRERGSWSRSLRRELRDLTEDQTALADRLDEMRESLAAYPVIESSLTHAAEPMRDAAGRLGESDAGAETIEHQRTAHQRLLAIVEVTKQAGEEQQPADGNVSPPQSPQQQPPEGQEPQVPQLLATQLRLLRHLQADVQRRTADLTERLASEDVNSEKNDQDREGLAREQERIAELTRTLLETLAEQSLENETAEPDQEDQP